MANAQTLRTHKSFTLNTAADWTNLITQMRANINAGAQITAADVNTIIDMTNNMLGHYHTYDDAYQLATYGAGYGNWPSAGDRTNYYEDKSTLRGAGFPTDIARVAVADTITLAKHNELAGASRSIRSHDHDINDRTVI